MARAITSRKRKKSPVRSAVSAPRLARRELRRERSREEILEAARRVLLRSGIAATTLDAVAREVGLTKAALYYYYPSKDALLFELVFGTLEAHAHSVRSAVDQAKNGGEALRAIVRETVRAFAGQLDDFRLAYLHGQVGGPGAVRVTAEQLARIRPLNDLVYGRAADIIAEGRKKRPSRTRVEPRILAFIASLAGIGLLTMKGMVENVGDPLLYSDEQLIEAFARVFEAAESA